MQKHKGKIRDNRDVPQRYRAGLMFIRLNKRTAVGSSGQWT